MLQSTPVGIGWRAVVAPVIGAAADGFAVGVPGQACGRRRWDAAEGMAAHRCRWLRSGGGMPLSVTAFSRWWSLRLLYGFFVAAPLPGNRRLWIWSNEGSFSLCFGPGFGHFGPNPKIGYYIPYLYRWARSTKHPESGSKNDVILIFFYNITS